MQCTWNEMSKQQKTKNKKIIEITEQLKRQTTQFQNQLKNKSI